MDGQHYGDCGTSLLHSSAQKRWRVLYLTIYLSRAMLSLSTGSSKTKNLKNLKNLKNPTTISSPPSFSILQIEPEPEPQHRCDDRSTSLLQSSAKKRWRILYLAVYLSRAVLSPKTKNIKNTSSPPFSSILQIEPEPEADDTAATDKAELTALAKEKNSDLLHRLGGIDGVISKLGTDKDSGINDDEADVGCRRQLFGSNAYNRPPSKCLFYFVKDAFKSTTIMISLACAALYLGYGINEQGPEKGWREGGSIFISVFVVTAVSVAGDLLQDRLFDKLSAVGDNIQVEVVRGGRRRAVSIFDIVVGDVVVLNIGDQVPADGLLLRGVLVHVDESRMTGESDHVEVECTGKNPFLISGRKVVDGHGAMVVTAVGMGTAWGEMMSSIERDSGREPTQLQARLNGLTVAMKGLGLAVAEVVLVAMLVRYFTVRTEDEEGRQGFHPGRTAAKEVVEVVLRIVANAAEVLIAVIPDGLSLAVTLTLVYTMKWMMADQAMSRKLSACETMGSADVICTEKTGTLTLNQMRVTKFWVGTDAIGEGGAKVETEVSRNFLNLLRQAVGFNTTGSVYRPAGSSKVSELELSGSPTERAILSWAVIELGMDIEKLKQGWSVVQMENFNSERKRSGVLIKGKGGVESGAHVHWKGAAEMVLARCSTYYDRKGSVKEIDRQKRAQMERIIQGMAAGSLRCIAFAQKKIQENQESSERRAGDQDEESEGKTTQKSLEEDELTLLGIGGLKDPCRPGVKKAVQTCQDAGVEIKMITGDNVFTAKAIATECGILGPDQQSDASAVVEGSDFQNFTDEERMQKIDSIRVMARSSARDKLLMVQCLKRKGRVVAVTGDGINDASALREADIGLSMGTNGTEVAKGISDVVILDDSFTSVAAVLHWGRCVYNKLQKFIQFQLTQIIAAIVINLIGAVQLGVLNERPPFYPCCVVQWWKRQNKYLSSVLNLQKPE